MEGILKKENGFCGVYERTVRPCRPFLGLCLFIGYSIINPTRWGKDGADTHLILTDISRFIPVGGAISAAIIGSIDLIIFFSGLYIDWKKKRLRKSIEEAVEKARAEGYAEGYEDEGIKILKKTDQVGGNDLIMLLSDWYTNGERSVLRLS